jgi:NAD(P) transhydrogenase subunit alpha
VAERAKQADIIITTALIPGRAAPVLLHEDTVKQMKPGSVVVDMAVEAGGNCLLSELGKTVVKHGVTIVGEANLPGLVATDASALYARNLLNFLNLLCDKTGAMNINLEDDIIAGTLLCKGGAIFVPAAPARGTPVGSPVKGTPPDARTSGGLGAATPQSSGPSAAK